jgi:DNA (cytosine-5)-methyltransferase 1
VPRIFKVLDLFAGIGGFSLGLERTGGFETVAFCENAPYCQKVLQRHWPQVPIYDDVRTLSAQRLRSDGIEPDVLTGGFPCQDISLAGKGAGLSGDRSGLWNEYRRLIEEIRPAFAIIENVSALRDRGLGEMLRALAAIGYDAEWHCIPAAAIGAPHRRDRAWIIAYPEGVGRGSGRQGRSDSSAAWEPQQALQEDAAHAACLLRPSLLRLQQDRNIQRYWSADWPTYIESLPSLDDGLSAGVGELAGYGNAVVPQIVEMIGYAIMAAGGQRAR